MGRFIDLTGKKFNKLTVVRRIVKSGSKKTFWLCKCACGNETIVDGSNLKNGITKSCGCLTSMINKIKALDGQRFGKLQVISFDNIGKNRNAYWLCKCDCGNKVVVRGSSLICGGTRSCGCLAIDEFKKRFTKHGESKTRLYSIWKGIKKRCSNKKGAYSKDYILRGITICDEWKNDFIVFKEWSLKNGYNEELTIERIDVNGNYNPDNCKWISLSEQAYNKQNTLFMTVDGLTKPMALWAKELNIDKRILWARVKILKWDDEKAIKTPLKVIKKCSGIKTE